MDTTNNIIEFHSKKEEMNNTELEQQQQSIPEEDMIAYPTNKEINIMNALVDQFAEENPDMPIPVNMWNGDCMHTIFDEMSNYAKEIQADPWDTFALFIQKLYGMKMIENEDGSVSVKYGKD